MERPPAQPVTVMPQIEVPPARRGIREICGHPVLELHCKVRCRNCGFIRDCTDP